MAAEHPQLQIDCRTLRARFDSGDPILLLDCREQNEHDFVRIEGARLIPMSELPTRVGELEAQRARDIVVYCHHGVRSLQVATWLRRQGFAKASSLSGGIDRWAQQIDPSLPRY